MAAGMRETAVSWVAERMKKNPEISMTELAKLGKKDRIHVYPLIIGLARKKLGMGPKRKAARKPRAAFALKRGPGRPRKSAVSGDAAAAITSMLTHMRELEREVVALRGALAKIGQIAAAS
mgnify:FL=1